MRACFWEGGEGWFGFFGCCSGGGVFCLFVWVCFCVFLVWLTKPEELQLDYFPVQTAVLV